MKRKDIPMKLDYKKTVLVGFAFFLISAFWQAYDAIIPLILNNHFGLPQTASGFVMSFDNILAVFLLPLFGSLSDKVNTRFGRRTPFIVIGTVLAVVFFIVLTFIDNLQLAKLAAEGVTEIEMGAMSQEEYTALITKSALELTMKNPLPLILFVAVLLLVLLSMATFRSPAVALMPDVTVKPLRSKANAIINLMGTAGGIIVLVFGMIFGTSKNPHMKFTFYVLAVIGVMLAGLVVFILKVKEKSWSDQMEEDSKAFGLVEQPEANKDESVKVGLSRPELISLLLILSSVALWYIGYNSITSKYSVYASTILGFDFNATLIIAQGAAIVSYIPVGIIASKIGRRKTILFGIVMLASAFFMGNFVSENTPELVMMPIFILAGMGWATINVNSFPMVVELAKGGDVGKYTGYYYTASMAAQIVAPILSGLLYDLVSMRIMFFAFGSLFVGLSFITMFFVKHGDSKPTAAEVLDAIDVD